MLSYHTLSHAVWHQRSAGVQLMVGITGRWHCFCDWGGGKVPSHTITSFAVGLSIYCCEFHTKQVEPSFVFVSWLSHAVWHQRSAGVQSIVGTAKVCRGAVDCWNHWRTALLSWQCGGKVPSHMILQFVFSSGGFILLVEELWQQCLGTFPSQSVNICLDILMASWCIMIQWRYLNHPHTIILFIQAKHMMELIFQS
jgi:hypothetical protein